MSSTASAASGSMQTDVKKKRYFCQEVREVVWNVYNYFKKQPTPGNVLEKVVEATGISRRTVVRIINEGRQIQTREIDTFKSRETTIQRPSPKSTVDEFAEQVIRRTIYNFHITDKQKPTVQAILNKVRDDEGVNFTGQITSFRTLLKKLGFRWKKTSDNRPILMERSEIRELRCAYIRAITKFQSENRPIIYTDETYINAGHTTPYEWVDSTNQGLRSPISKGKRLIIVHAGGENGFIENALLIFESGKKTGDYHDEMNFNNYTQWLNTQLIPNLPPNSVVVVDNASYHNVLAVKHPNTNSRKEEMVTWLNQRGIGFDATYTKADLYKIIKIHKPSHAVYSIDEIFKRHGHTVCRLPPYHPELNPIEKIWASCKNWVAKKNVSFKLSDVQMLVRERFSHINNEWENVCRHVVDIEKNYIEKEHILDTYCDQFIINLEDESSDDADFNLSDSDENS